MNRWTFCNKLKGIKSGTLDAAGRVHKNNDYFQLTGLNNSEHLQLCILRYHVNDSFDKMAYWTE